MACVLYNNHVIHKIESNYQNTYQNTFFNKKSKNVNKIEENNTSFLLVEKIFNIFL